MKLGCLIAASVLLLSAGPALASGGARGKAARDPKKKLRATTVVDRTVGGVVVERKILLRPGGGKRRARPVSVESKVEAMKKGALLSDAPAELPGELTLKGRLVEQSYREAAGGGGTITLVRPGARHLSGPEARQIYSGGRVRRIERLKKPVRGRQDGRQAPARQMFQMGVSRVMSYRGDGQWVESPAQGSMTTGGGSGSVNLQGETGDGLLASYGVERQALIDAMAYGEAPSGRFTVTANQGWVAVVPNDNPRGAIAFGRLDVEHFLKSTY